MNLPDAEAAVLIAKHELWRRGDLKWKLDPTQKKIYKAIEQGKRKHFLLCARRIGKSYLLVVHAFEHAIRNPGSRVSFAAPTAKDASQIVTDIASEILMDCPEDLKPDFYIAEREYRFSNGSIIRFAGLNAEHAQNLRGRKATLFIIDEVGLVDDLNHVVQDIAMPMTLTTGGRLLFASTPPRSPGHASTTLAKKMLAAGEVSVFTILDNTRVTDEVKAEYLVEAGELPERVADIIAGRAEPETSTALREYWCRLDITDAETAVVPEFTAQAQKEIVLEHPTPPYRDCYVSVDPGFNDKTGGLFAYWDFSEKKLVIEDEFLLARASTDDIASVIKAKEEQLWGERPPLLRILDVDLRLRADLIKNHGLIFNSAERGDALGAIDTVRTMVRRREIIILPNCTNLIRQLRNATWNRKGSDFERTAEDAHFDLLASLKYLARSVLRTKNPYPSWYLQPGFGHHTTAAKQETKSVFSTTPLGRKFAKKWG